MPDLIPDQKKAVVCSCGGVSYALRGDGFCECHGCGKVGHMAWDWYGKAAEAKDNG